MRKLLKNWLLFFILFLVVLNSVPVGTYAYDGTAGAGSSAAESDVVILSPSKNDFSYSRRPLAQYAGENGVTIRSYSNGYLSQDSLKKVYDELLKNGHGEEISYLSYVDLIGDFPYGVNTAGKWYGQWENGRLTSGRYIELYGCDTMSFTEIARTLSHEYGHHFTYYYLGKGENKDVNSIMESGFAKIRKLNSYNDILDGEHMWDPSEIAAEDYVQFFGSPTGKESTKFEDVRDQTINGTIGSKTYNTLMYNLCPQENEDIQLAWRVSGLYQYWSGLSGVKVSDVIPPTVPFLALVSAANGTLKLTWTQSTDNDTNDVEYTLVAFSKESSALYGIRTTTDAIGREAIVGTYRTSTMEAWDNILSSKMYFRVYAEDRNGNIVSSNDLLIDPANPAGSISLLPNRISGQDRYETSVEISMAEWPKTSDTAILVTGDDFPDALSAAPIAKLYNAPILLTHPDTISDSVNKELDRLNVKNIIIIGGPGAVSNSIEESLKSRGINCTRIAGDDRYGTSVEVAKAMGGYEKAVLATGNNFPDALSAASYAASMGLPIILTDGQKLSDPAFMILSDKNVQSVYVVGGKGVISDSLVSNINGAIRLSGDDRYGTNLAVINEFKNDFDMTSIYIATGDNYPDALAGSALAGMKKAPIFLIDRLSAGNVRNYITPFKDRIKNINVLGGDGAVENDILLELMMKN